MKIYTKRGDTGRSRLSGGEDVAKSDARMEALGAIDELVAVLGLARAEIAQTAEAERLTRLQKALYLLLSEIGGGDAHLDTAAVAALEREIDAIEAALPELRNFIMPGESRASAALHLARTVCRRAERRLVALNGVHAARPVLLAYLNRLSDLLFVLARFVDHNAGIGDRPFKSGG